MAHFPAPAPLAEADEPPPLPPAPPVSAAEIGAARAYVEASRAAATRRAYDGDWLYLATRAAAGRAPPSIARALAAIAHTHKRAGLTAPHREAGGSVIAEALSGIRRACETPTRRKAPADAEVLLALLRSIAGDGLLALRDRALLAFGMALAARRSELVALDVADLQWEENGLRVTIRRSKTDQEGGGAVVARCPRAGGSSPSPICAPGSRRLRSPKARCSGRSGKAASGCALRDCRTTRSAASCRRGCKRRDWIPSTTAGTACVRGS
jgi:integrase